MDDTHAVVLITELHCDRNVVFKFLDHLIMMQRLNVVRVEAKHKLEIDVCLIQMALS